MGEGDEAGQGRVGQEAAGPRIGQAMGWRGIATTGALARDWGPPSRTSDMGGRCRRQGGPSCTRFTLPCAISVYVRAGR